MKQKLMLLGVSLLFGLGMCFWAYILKKENEKLEIQIEQGAKKQEELERKIDSLIKDYNTSVEVLTNSINEKEALTKELNKKRLNVRSKNEKDVSPVLIDTSEFVLERLREQKADRNS